MQSQNSGASAPHSYASPHALVLNLPHTRSNAGVSLESIADSTKISLRFLRAIEAEEFEKLPGGIFSTSYLKQYAAAIGFDEAELLSYFDYKMNPKVVPEEDSALRAYRWFRIPAQAEQ